MKQLKLNNRDYVFVPVPEEADITDMQMIADGEFAYSIPNPDPDYNDYVTKYITLPLEGVYKFIATTDTITEEHAAGIVEKSIYSNRLYLNYQFGGVNEYAIDSFKSLLKHHSLTGRYAIIEKI